VGKIGVLNQQSEDDKYSSEQNYTEDYSSVNNRSGNNFDAPGITKEEKQLRNERKFQNYEKIDTEEDAKGDNAKAK
jgi:hypothetical protein